ncbi:cell division regulator GpsB [Erwinia sp. CPCC 100877]|nr:cell division regulator GpsB [Erwinia sp. CPCC 100877]
MANIVYSPKDILQKEFKTKKIGGYDPVEVDEFLDNVIKDYEAYNKELLTLQEENNRLLAKLDQASKVQQSAPRGGQEMPKSAAVTNFDILKRLSNLEREVFGKKLDDTPASNPISGMSHTNPYESSLHSSYDRDYDHSETRQF